MEFFGTEFDIFFIFVTLVTLAAAFHQLRRPIFAGICWVGAGVTRMAAPLWNFIKLPLQLVIAVLALMACGMLARGMLEPQSAFDPPVEASPPTYETSPRPPAPPEKTAVLPSGRSSKGRSSKAEKKNQGKTWAEASEPPPSLVDTHPEIFGLEEESEPLPDYLQEHTEAGVDTPAVPNLWPQTGGKAVNLSP